MSLSPNLRSDFKPEVELWRNGACAVKSCQQDGKSNFAKSASVWFTYLLTESVPRGHAHRSVCWHCHLLINKSYNGRLSQQQLGFLSSFDLTCRLGCSGAFCVCVITL